MRGALGSVLPLAKWVHEYVGLDRDVDSKVCCWFSYGNDYTGRWISVCSDELKGDGDVRGE